MNTKVTRSAAMAANGWRARRMQDRVLFMPAIPRVGQSFQQERAPEVAKDRSEVVEVGLEVTTPAGTFSKCIKTKDVAPLDDVTEFKYYCPGAELVREDVPQGRV